MEIFLIPALLILAAMLFTLVMLCAIWWTHKY